MTRPNFLIVMTDHQRADTVRPDHPARTPNVERLAREGVSFSNTFCPTPHCCPSRATFMSGLYPSGHGIWNNVLNRQALATSLNDGVRLWSEDLAAAGYRMHYSGKWHVSGEENPADRGWTEHDPCAIVGQKHGGGWETFNFTSAPDGEEALREPGCVTVPGWKPGDSYRIYGSSKGNAGDECTTAHAVRLLGELAGGDEPWCLFAGLTGPHDPYCVPQKYLDMYDIDDVPLPGNYSDEMADKPRIYQRMRRDRFGQLSEFEVRDAIRHFWAYCSYLDNLFGQMLKALEDSGQSENTVVIYCSDHGDYCGEHGLFCKGIPCFSGAYHVPAVVRWPAGLVNPGRSIEKFVSLADFAPTLLELAGIDAGREFHGRSLAGFIGDRQPEEWRDALVTQCNGVELYFTQRSILTEKYRYTFNGFDFDELYDLQKDPGETVNLADRPENRGLVKELCARMLKIQRQLGDACPSAYITVGLYPQGPASTFA